jgi:1,4-alpha-glucan branching enzyme
MLFMGEEWGAREPFPYFCDFDEDLNEKVRKGRREELSRLPGFDADDLLYPTAQSTFEMAKLDWSQLDGPGRQKCSRSTSRFLHCGTTDRAAAEVAPAGGSGSFRRDGSVTAVEWTLAHGAKLHLLANLSDEPARITSPPSGDRIFCWVRPARILSLPGPSCSSIQSLRVELTI